MDKRHLSPRLASSGLRGVKWNGFSWTSTIWYRGKSKVLGYFPTRLGAAQAYDRWCYLIRGDRPNQRILANQS